MKKKLISGRFFFNFLTHSPFLFFEPLVEKILKINWFNRYYFHLMKKHNETFEDVLINAMRDLNITEKTYYTPGAYIPKRWLHYSSNTRRRIFRCHFFSS